MLYDEATKVAKWTIGKIAVGKTATLSGTMVIQGASQDLPPMQLSWKVPMASVSGIQISSLLDKGTRVGHWGDSNCTDLAVVDQNGEKDTRTTMMLRNIPNKYHSL